MRKTVLSLMSITALALAGCNAPAPSQQTGKEAPASANSATTASTAATSAANEVSGTISLRGSVQPSANATLVLNLVDVSATAAGSAPLASKTSPAGSFPQPFKLSFNPAEVKPDDL